MSKKILVVGASGYIASRLIPVLLEKGHSVRCLARDPRKLARRAWINQVEVVQADVSLIDSLPPAVEGCEVIYYLVHSMSAGKQYNRLDQISARNLGSTAAMAGVGRIIYLGGLADREDEKLAPHLYSRLETGDTLRESGIPVIEFRSGVIIGAGSVSFEMIRALADQFPVLVGPTWLRNKTQPAATRDVVSRLVDALEIKDGISLTTDLGSDEVFSYIQIMLEYARISEKKRLSVLLPFIPPQWMAYFISLLTPVSYAYALPLVQGLKNDSLVQFPLPPEHFPQAAYLSYRQALELALAETNPQGSGQPWLDSDKKQSIGLYAGLAVDYQTFPNSAATNAIRLAEVWELEWLGKGWKILNKNENEDFFQGEFIHRDFGKLWLEVRSNILDNETIWERTICLRPSGAMGYWAFYWYRWIQRFRQGR